MLKPMKSTANRVVRDVLERLDNSATTFILGICGPPGAGKSYAAAAIRSVFERAQVPTAVVPMDGFHLSNAQLALLGLAGVKGAPQTFDVAGLVNLLTSIRTRQPGDEILAPAYDRIVHEPVAARIRITGRTRLVIVEGNYLLLDRPGWRDIAGLLDASWYLDVPADLREQRLVERHVAGGRPPEDACVWVATVDRANAGLVAATRERATYATDGTALTLELSQVAQP